jgi:hypothetical protein
MASKLTSPVFEYVIPAGLLPGGVHTQNLEMVADTTADYAPFNVLTVDNFSTKTVKVLYGAGHFVYLRGNSMAEIAQNGIRSFSVVNVDTTNATDGFILVYVQKRITPEIALEAIARRIPVEKLMGGE